MYTMVFVAIAAGLLIVVVFGAGVLDWWRNRRYDPDAKGGGS